MFIVLLITSIFVMVSSYIVAITRRRKYNTKIDLPGPPGLPFFGNALQMNRRRPWETLSAWRQLYGDAYVIHLFSEPTLVLCGHEAIREALSERGRDFAGRPRPFFRAGFMADSYQDVVSGSPGPIWNALRRAVQRALRSADPSGTRSGPGRWTESLTVAIVEEMCEEFGETGGLAFNPRISVYNAVMNMTCMMLIGDRFRRDDDELAMYKCLERLITTSMSVGGRGSELDLFPWLRHVGNATYRKLVEAKRLRDVLYDRLRERVASGEMSSTTRRGVVRALFDALRNEDTDRGSYGVTENHIKLAIVNLLIGGAASSTGYIYAAINVLSQHPQVQERLRAEIDEVIGWNPTNSQVEDARRTVTLDDKPSMPYTMATVFELLRYASLSPILIPHRTLADTRIGGVRIPAGVQVFMHIRSVHHDVEFWSDPYRFRPERFLKRENHRVDEAVAARWSLEPADGELRRRLMSFSAGPRACPGEAVAMTRLFLTIANVVNRFVLVPETGPAGTGCPTSSSSDDLPLPSCDPRTYEPGLVLCPKDFNVRFISR